MINENSLFFTLSYGDVVEDGITREIMECNGIIYNERRSATESEVKLWSVTE